MRKPTNINQPKYGYHLRSNVYMMHHKPYCETRHDWGLAVAIALCLCGLMFAYFDFSLFGR